VRVVTAGLLWATLVVGLIAQGSPEVPTLTGVVSLKGNVPFTYLCLTDAAGQGWKLKVPDTLDLGPHLGQTVTLEVKAIPPRPEGPTPYPPEVEVTKLRN
jgi:hypothetical protein